MKLKSSKKVIDNRINAAFKRTCSGIQINILDIGKVFTYGRSAIAQGIDDETLARVIREYVETIRVDGGKS